MCQIHIRLNLRIGQVCEATARGKLKTEEIKPMVGDNVLVEILENGTAVIEEIQERKIMLKRPRVSNITQVIFVVSSTLPKPNLLILDKELAYSSFIRVKPIIVINKIDLNSEVAEKIYNIYKSAGFDVIKTDSLNGIGIDLLKEKLKNNTSVLARTIWRAENPALQIEY